MYERTTWTVEGSGIGEIGGSWFEHPRLAVAGCLVAWPLHMRVLSRPEPPGAPRGGSGAEPGLYQITSSTVLQHHHSLHLERVGAHLERASVLLDRDHQRSPRVETHDGGAAARTRGHDHRVNVIAPEVRGAARRAWREQ